MTDLQGYERRLGLCVKRIEKEACPTEDKELIRDFIFHCQAQGVSFGRLYKLSWTLLSVRRMMSFTFKGATRKDIEKLVAKINTTDSYTPNTRSDTKKILKRFYKFVRYGNADKATPFPAEVSWITTEVKRNEQKEPDIRSEGESKRLVESAITMCG